MSKIKLAVEDENIKGPKGLNSAVPLPLEARKCIGGASWPWQLLVTAILVGVAAFLLQVIGDARIWVFHRMEVLLAMTGIAFWRWSWFAIQNARAVIYRYITWPRLRREAQEAIRKHGPVPEVIILATTYHEKIWITQSVFDSVYYELSTLKGLQRRSRLVVVTGGEDDDENLRAIHHQWCTQAKPEMPEFWPPELVLLRGDKGKRPALATGMKEIASRHPHKDGVVVVLDGDTLMQPGLLDKVLPVFRLSPAVGGTTTNENGFVKGPAWFAEWTALRFGLRHRSMCSVSLSGKLLCLTGRFSVFRASVVVDPSFQLQVEHDVITHWLWGSFEMLSGDDKSTWFWLSANGHRMLYVPDAMVTTLEVVAGSSVRRATANIRRWSGNSIRHSWRAIKLGPKKLGWFPWWCLVDQRLTTFSVLFGPAVAILAAISGRFEMVAGYFLWVMLSRVSHASISWRQGRRFSACYIPLQILSDWTTALTKMWVMFHPAKQNWLNRGGRTLNTTEGSAFYKLRTGFAHYLYVFSCAALVAFIGLFIGFLPLAREARLFLSPSHKAKPVKDSVQSPSRPVPMSNTNPTPSVISPGETKVVVALKQTWTAPSVNLPGQPATINLNRNLEQ
ncbi:MAG: Mannuronan synthase [Verrucomicrobiales bacterium]|nr:Mannuronan synthase [Verrucomicrobiales bacterium]